MEKKNGGKKDKQIKRDHTLTLAKCSGSLRKTVLSLAMLLQ